MKEMDKIKNPDVDTYWIIFDEDDKGAISRDEVAIVIQSLLGG